MLALSLDMGGTHIGCAVVEDKAILASAAVDVERAASLESLLPQIQQTLRSLMQQAEVDTSSCKRMAIGFPGIIDVRSGRIISTLKKYEDAKQLDLQRWSLESFGTQLLLENDARMALLGEQYAGSAQDKQDVVMITLGTGIGGAAMIGGRLLRGAHSQAGCLGGHLPVDFRGRTCACGNIGCAEAEAAGWSLPGILRDSAQFAESALSTATRLDFKTLFDSAEQGDSLAIEIRQRCLDVWAANAVALIHAYDPEVVIFGGGVMKNAVAILPHIQNHMASHAWTTWGTPEVRAAKLENNAGLLGAIPLFLEELS